MRSSQLTNLAVCLMLFLWVGSGCDPVSPPEHIRTPLDYTWTRDTLGDGSFQSLPGGIWGIADNDVYLVGHSSDFGRWKMWHFDGKMWSDISSVYFETFPGPPWYFYAPNVLTGFASGDVWVAGRYDSTEIPGQVRRGFALHRKPNGAWEGFRIPGAPILEAIGGTSTEDLWVGGQYGQTFHYNGSTWTEHRIADSATIVVIRAAPDGSVYASGWGRPGSGIEVQYFRWSGTQWKKIEELMTLNSGSGPEAGISFDVLEDGGLISATGSFISRRMSQGSWTVLHLASNANLFSVKATGGYAFALGRMRDWSEAAYCYDGKRWSRIATLNAPNADIWRAWSTSTATFLVGIETTTQGTLFPRTYVIRGK